ncbi:hypothetical protein MHK_004498, partial [Candidatus Magnetomorum sp. HK-1]
MDKCGTAEGHLVIPKFDDSMFGPQYRVYTQK